VRPQKACATFFGVAKLQISFIKGKRKGTSFTFSQAVVRVGKHPDNDLVLDSRHDRKTSGYHAEIRRDGDRYILHDLDSTHGTIVEGARIETEYALTAGDRVMFGHSGPMVKIAVIGTAHDPKDPTSNIDLVPEVKALGPMQDSETSSASDPNDNQTPSEQESISEAPKGGRPSQKEAVKEQLQTTVEGENLHVPSGKSTFYRAMMAETVRKSRRPLIIMIVALTILLLLVSMTWFLYSNGPSNASINPPQADQEDSLSLEKKAKVIERKIQATQRANLITRNKIAEQTNALITLRQRLRKKSGPGRKSLENQASGVEASRAELVMRLGEQQREIANLKEEPSAEEEIASRYGKALFMLVAQTPAGKKGYCTAFAITRTGLLATNGHCARFAEHLHAHKLHSVAHMNSAPELTYEIQSWKIHPGYNGTTLSADVALMQLELQGKELPVAILLASAEEVLGLRPGRPIYTLGYSEEMMNPERPDARLRAGVIARLSTYDKTPGNPKLTNIMWHSELTRRDTAGSPIFNTSGKVVAINNEGLGTRRILTEGPTGNKQVDIVYDTIGLNFGVRVDTLHEMIPHKMDP
jgi:pSer/pThr/pTyr-binding forkhead associated (FHA) protein